MKQQPVGSYPVVLLYTLGAFQKGLGFICRQRGRTYLISAVSYAVHFQGLPPTTQLNPQQVNSWEGDHFSVSIEMGSFLILMDLLLARG